jgi:ubiquinone/menaquinone biosynthesis C-methylase UbiE
MHATIGGVATATTASQKSMISELMLRDIQLRCPRCKVGIPELECLQCGFQLRDIDGILHALPPERVVHYARFIEEYERIRDAEGRGSEGDEFYLGLPYNDRTGRNGHQWYIRARTFDHLVRRVLKPRLPTGAQILDLGAGNCWMSYRLALAGFRPIAVDLLTNNRDGLGAAEHYRNYLPEFFPRFRGDLAELPFQNGQFDAVVFNASFHYAEDFEAVLREAFRCAKRGGTVVIGDTPWYSSDASGRKMVSERHSNFLRCYGTTSASIESLEYLTDERLKSLEDRLSIHWSIYSPSYGLKWAMRPIVSKLRNKREPARFRIYVAEKA